MQVVVRALSVLKLLARRSRGLTLGEIGEQLGLPVATAHRIVAVLESERFVTRSTSNRRYFLGPAAHELGLTASPRQSPLVTAHEAVAEANRASGETIFLSEFSINRVVCLALAESIHPLRLFVRVGQSMPLHAAASARVLLAWRDSEEVRRLIGDGPLPSFTNETPRMAADVQDRLRLIRSRGFDLCESELDENVWAVSAPVRNSTDSVVASVTLAAPGSRVAAEKDRDKCIDIITSAAGKMSADLGWAGPVAYV